MATEQITETARELLPPPAINQVGGCGLRLVDDQVQFVVWDADFSVIWMALSRYRDDGSEWDLTIDIRCTFDKRYPVYEFSRCRLAITEAYDGAEAQVFGVNGEEILRIEHPLPAGTPEDLRQWRSLRQIPLRRSEPPSNATVLESIRDRSVGLFGLSIRLLASLGSFFRGWGCRKCGGNESDANSNEGQELR